MPEICGDLLGFVVELVPGEAGDAVAGNAEAAVAGAVVAKGTAGGVAGPAVHLDDLSLRQPEAVDLVPPPARFDPGVEAGARQQVSVEEGQEPFLEAAADASFGVPVEL